MKSIHTLLACMLLISVTLICIINSQENFHNRRGGFGGGGGRGGFGGGRGGRGGGEYKGYKGAFYGSRGWPRYYGYSYGWPVYDTYYVDTTYEPDWCWKRVDSYETGVQSREQWKNWAQNRGMSRILFPKSGENFILVQSTSGCMQVNMNDYDIVTF